MIRRISSILTRTSVHPRWQRRRCSADFFSSRRWHTIFDCDWSSDVCSSDLPHGVRDAQAVWTGSMNWTDDAFGLEENAIVRLDSADVAAAYRRDFEQLWSGGTVERSGGS